MYLFIAWLLLTHEVVMVIYSGFSGLDLFWEHSPQQYIMNIFLEPQLSKLWDPSPLTPQTKPTLHFSVCSSHCFDVHKCMGFVFFFFFFNFFSLLLLSSRVHIVILVSLFDYWLWCPYIVSVWLLFLRCTSTT